MVIDFGRKMNRIGFGMWARFVVMLVAGIWTVWGARGFIGLQIACGGVVVAVLFGMAVYLFSDLYEGNGDDKPAGSDGGGGDGDGCGKENKQP